MSTPQHISRISENFLMLNGLKNVLPRQKEKEEDPAPRFVHPILTPKDFKESITRYNQHIKKYNLQVLMGNAEVRDYNKEVIRNRKKITVTAEQKVQEMIWKENHKDLSPEEFNEAVEAYNNEHGPQLRKKNLRTEVKPDSEKFFIAFLHQLNMQLFKRKELRAGKMVNGKWQEGLGIHHPGEIPKVDIYPNKIIEAERDGYRNLRVSVETVRHHRERLEEAGVLLDYQFRGPNRAVKMRINPEILSITDNGIPKNARTENQTVTGEKANKVPHNNVSSRNTSLEENKNRDKGVAATASTDHNCTEESTKTPNRQGGKNSDAPVKADGDYKKNSPAPREKNELSTVLATSLDDRADFAKDLAAGKHDQYRRISEKIARQEAYYGALHPDDFKELAIQDIFKFAASLFSQLNVHPGSWMNAYKIWMKEKFTSFNGHTLSKPNTFEQWQKAILVLREVKKFQKKHPEWEPHYPSLYFDPARTFKENNSFEYAYRFFRLNDEKVESLQKRKIEARKSLRSKTDVKKAQEQIRRMIHGEISIDRLFDYVQQNCSKAVQDNLNQLVKKEFEKVQNA